MCAYQEANDWKRVYKCFANIWRCFLLLQSNITVTYLDAFPVERSCCLAVLKYTQLSRLSNRCLKAFRIEAKIVCKNKIAK